MNFRIDKHIHVQMYRKGVGFMNDNNVRLLSTVLLGMIILISVLSQFFGILANMFFPLSVFLICAWGWEFVRNKGSAIRLIGTLVILAIIFSTLLGGVEIFKNIGAISLILALIVGYIEFSKQANQKVLLSILWLFTTPIITISLVSSIFGDSIVSYLAIPLSFLISWSLMSYYGQLDILKYSIGGTIAVFVLLMLPLQLTIDFFNINYIVESLSVYPKVNEFFLYDGVSIFGFIIKLWAYSAIAIGIVCGLILLVRYRKLDLDSNNDISA